MFNNFLGFKTPSKTGNSRLSMGSASRSQLKRSSMSGSVGMLNQAASDMTNEVSSFSDEIRSIFSSYSISFNHLQSESDQERRGSLMKPTISSQNKTNGGMTSSSSAMRSSNSNLRRRGMQSSGEIITFIYN